jgi:plastocyanin
MRRTTWVATVGTIAMLTLPASAAALTKTVHAGGPRTQEQKLALRLLGARGKAILHTYSPAVLTFVQTTVTIHTGDKVRWSGLANGFHTVDLPGRSGHDLPLFTHEPTISGVDDFAGNPFWFNGVKPGVTINPMLFAPIGGTTYDGSKRVDSGGPFSNTPSDTLTVTFTKPGIYRYFCDIHPGMVGYVVVKPKNKPIPSAAQDQKSIVKQLTSDILAAKPLLHAKPPANHVDLGESTPNGQLAFYHFFPATLNVAAGTVVTFSVPRPERTEGHTAAFGPASYVTALANASSDAATQQQVYPSSNPAAGPVVLSPTSHGNGFANTGLLDQDPGGFFPASEKIRFTTPGTYHFICLIHPFMTGTIVVH